MLDFNKQKDLLLKTSHIFLVKTFLHIKATFLLWFFPQAGLPLAARHVRHGEENKAVAQYHTSRVATVAKAYFS
jgi:hypothetical protein